MGRIRWWEYFLALIVFGASGLLIGYLLTPLPPQELPQATRVLAADGELIARIGIEDRIVVPLEEMPRYLLEAVIAQEDHRFYRHFGIDPVGIARAVIKNFQAREIVEGGSTITQQLARTWFLSMERTVTRKLQEALLALKIESQLSKDEILEHYLNSIYMGHGAWGMEVASQTYFGKSVREINLAEAALLAGIIGAPEHFTPHRRPDLARQRQLNVLQRMVDLGYITPATARAAAQVPLQYAESPGQDTEKSIEQAAGYFIDYVRHVLRQELPEVAANLERGGYVIHTTMDVHLQQVAVSRLREGLSALDTGSDDKEVAQPQGALVAMDPATGYIKALVGGRDFKESPYNRAYRARRQPGSAFKVFVYTAAIDQGYPVTAVQACVPVEFPGTAGGEPYRPQDYQSEQGRPYHYEFMAMREAVAISDNVVAVRWTHLLGPKTVAEYSRRLGISEDTPLEETLPLALGASVVSPLELTRAYATLANLGYRVEPIAVLRVENSQGQVIFQQEPQLVPVLDPGTAYIMTDLLKSVLEEGGTGAHLRSWFSKPAAGKTGTTDQRRNAWFVGYTPTLVTAVYVGNDDESPLPGSGGTIAGPIWARFMADATAGQPAYDWDVPDNVVAAAACTITGPVDFPRPQIVEEVFLAGRVPPPMCW